MKKFYKNKNVLVYGMSSSGIWASKLLKKLKANLFVFDDDETKLKELGLTNCTILNKITDSIIKTLNIIIVSPAIEKTNKVIQLAKQNNIMVISELEFAAQFCKKLVAVTGTNGKTTTVELITSILKTKYKAISCGNIGYPLSKAVLKNRTSIKVVEVSSFMLENAKTFSPNVATVLNISPDHLVRHKTMQEYTSLKLSIFKNLKPNNYAVLNLDENLNMNLNCKTLTYSYSKMADVRVKDGAIYLKDKKLLNINQLKLKGKHNIYNVMCAVCFAYIFRVKPEKIKTALMSFTPSQFRNEHIATINNIKFINDSKSTNLASTFASVEANKGSLILMLGGSKKDLNYTQFFQNLTKRVKLIIAFGEIKEMLEQVNNQKFKMEICQNLDEAFNVATNNALANDTILFSPSSASYDQFKNYIERGNKFNEKVKEYEIKQTQK